VAFTFRLKTARRVLLCRVIPPRTWIETPPRSRTAGHKPVRMARNVASIHADVHRLYLHEIWFRPDTRHSSLPLCECYVVSGLKKALPLVVLCMTWTFQRSTLNQLRVVFPNCIGLNVTSENEEKTYARCDDA